MKYKSRPRYKLMIEDESRLEILGSWTTTRRILILAAVVFVLFSLAGGACLIVFTPMKNLLPGYLKKSERTAVELQMMRIDSLRLALEANSIYLDNVSNILGYGQSSQKLSENNFTGINLGIDNGYDSISPTDSILLGSEENILAFDSLLTASPEERRFQKMMSERERYNIAVIAPLAGESLLFRPVSSESVFTRDSQTLTKGELIVGKGATISAIADGTVIAVTQSLRDGGSTVIIQHPKGFVSRLSRLGMMLVEVGESVKAGQAIALTNKGNARKAEKVTVEMWFDGDPLIPYEYIGTSRPAVPKFPVSFSRRSNLQPPSERPDTISQEIKSNSEESPTEIINREEES